MAGETQPDASDPGDDRIGRREPTTTAGAVVGKVAGTADSTPLKFHVAIADGSYLQMDDAVTCSRDVPGVDLVTTSGVVTEVVPVTRVPPSAPTCS